MSNRFPKVLSLLAVAGLAGCANPDGFNPGCPSVAIVRDADWLVASAADGQVASNASLTSVNGVCEYSDAGVSVHIALRIDAEAASGQPAGQANYDYFVAVTDPDRNILAKQVYTASVDLTGGKGATREQLAQFIALPKTIDGRYYQILVGFQLSPDQVEANRQANERRPGS